MHTFIQLCSLLYGPGMSFLKRAFMWLGLSLLLSSCSQDLLEGQTTPYLSPEEPEIIVGQAATFTMNNGHGPYTYEIIEDISADIATINSSTGVLTTGTKKGSFTVRATDQFGVQAQTAVTVMFRQFNVGVNVNNLQTATGFTPLQVKLTTDGTEPAPRVETISIGTSGVTNMSATQDETMTYHAEIVAQPTYPWQTCSFTGASSGTITGANVSIGIDCTVNTYAISGTINNPAADTMNLTDSVTGNTYTIPASASTFTFAPAFASLSNYNLSVSEQPDGDGKYCFITNNIGQMVNAAISNVSLDCYQMPSVVSVTPSQNGVLNTGDNIVIQFSESIDTSSCAMTTSGLTDEIAGYPTLQTFSTTTNANDTLTLSPSTTFAAGQNRLLQIRNCADTDGAPLAHGNFVTQYGATYAEQQIDVTFHVADATRARFISPTGNDVNPGTAMGSPKRSLSSALASFGGSCSTGTDCMILAVDGNYNETATVNMIPGVSVLGGFAADYASRDEAGRGSHFTVTLNGAGTLAAPVSGVVFNNAAFDNNTVFSGSEITLSSGTGITNSAAVFVQAGAPIFRHVNMNGYNCNVAGCSTTALYSAGSIGMALGKLTGGSATGGVGAASYGLRVTGANNEFNVLLISAGTSSGTSAAALLDSATGAYFQRVLFNGGAATYSYGLRTNNATLTLIKSRAFSGDASQPSSTSIAVSMTGGSAHIVSNVIASGGATSGGAASGYDTMGIYANGSSGRIVGNTIDGGNHAGQKAAAVYLANSASHEMINNILTLGNSATSGECLVEATATEDPVSFLYNNFHNCPVYYHDADSGLDATATCTGNIGNGACTLTVSPAAGGTTALDPIFDDHAAFDYGLSTSVPCGLIHTGLTFMGDENTDRLGFTRSGGPGITKGAHEEDGGCL